MTATSLVPKDVLLVEGEPARRAHLAQILEQSGYSALAVGSVSEALAALERSRFLFSLVNLDLGADDGMVLLRELKRQREGGRSS